MNQLTTIASLPMGGGVAAALPAEVGKQVTVQMKAPYFDDPVAYLVETVALQRNGYTVNAQGVIERVK